jgi:hypothetical protein
MRLVLIALGALTLGLCLCILAWYAAQPRYQVAQFHMTFATVPTCYVDGKKIGASDGINVTTSAAYFPVQFLAAHPHGQMKCHA